MRNAIKVLMCGVWKQDEEYMLRFAREHDKFGCLTTRPDLRENISFYSPIFLFEHEEL